MPAYRLTQDAEDDLRKIARYTLETWGAEQARRYGQTLEAHFEARASGKVRGKAVLKKWPDLSVSRCEHHYVFTLKSPNEPSIIIAILHERMDMLRHLKKRIED